MRINTVPTIGPIGRATYRALFVAAAAAVRSDGSTIAAMYACRVGTSICDNAKRASRRAIALPKVGANGTRINSTFEGRCVKTIVLSKPARAAIRGAITEDAAWSRPAAKITVDISSWLGPDVLENQNTMNTLITKPPANASTANSDDSFVTVARDRSSGIRLRATSVSRPADKPAASHRQIAAPIGNSRNQARPVGAAFQ